MFDKHWHKLQFSIRQDGADLYVDCEFVATSPVEPRGPIDVSGEIVLGKNVEGETAHVCLNWSWC